MLQKEEKSKMARGSCCIQASLLLRMVKKGRPRLIQTLTFVLGTTAAQLKCIRQSLQNLLTNSTASATTFLVRTTPFLPKYLFFLRFQQVTTYEVK